jgi:hypothetical protein
VERLGCFLHSMQGVPVRGQPRHGKHHLIDMHLAVIERVRVNPPRVSGIFLKGNAAGPEQKSKFGNLAHGTEAHLALIIKADFDGQNNLKIKTG